MEELVVITGGGTGIGQALAFEFAKNNFEVLIVGRTEKTLEETAAIHPEKITYVMADITTAKGRESILKKIGSKKIKILIHNAGTIEPISNLLEVKEEDFKQNLAINLEAPLFLTQLLLNHFQQGARIFHVSSGVAHSAMSGWGAYCIAKAALVMMFQVLKIDLMKYGVVIGSAFPGVVDTPMQEVIRSAKPEDFPFVEKFRRLKEKGKLLSPEKVAQCFAWLILQTDDATFSEKDWDIDELVCLL